MSNARPTEHGSAVASRAWAALVVASIAQLVVALDATIVNVALPSAQKVLGFDDVDRAWVVTAYTLPFAGLLLLGGRIVDRVGQRAALLGAMSGFAAASALAGAAPGLGLLVTGRALQGACAAVMAPAALSTVATSFTDPRLRGKAFGVFGAVASGGAVVGLLLGGVLTETLGWRWCLLVNVAVCIPVALVGRTLLPSRSGDRRARLDVPSAVLATAGLVGLVLGCSRAAQLGWASPSVVVSLLAGAALTAAFFVRQSVVESPLLPLDILRDRVRVAAYLACAAGVLAMFGAFLMLTYYYQAVLGYSPARTGLAFVPMTLAVVTSAYGLASRLMHRVAPALLVVPGLVVCAAGLALLSTLDASSGYLTSILPGEVLAGAGIGCVVTPSVAAATSRVDPRRIGIASAVANVAMQAGASVGTAVLNTVAVHGTGGSTGAEALVRGYTAAAAWSAGLLLLAAVIVSALLVPARGERRAGSAQGERMP